jgi:catechol 2,3-dioxygenase-like lactoylglutathione lyase family enzyme
MKRPFLTPELSCSNFAASLKFYKEILGFEVLYDRPESSFAMLERQGARIMLEQAEVTDRWRTADLEYPFGRGVNFQILTSRVDSLYGDVVKAGVKIFVPLEDQWYRANDKYIGNRHFLLQDPDGYLLRFFESLGERAELPA